MSEHKEPIPSMLYNAAVGGHVTNSQQIIDENINREQSDVNQEVLFGEPYNSTTPNGMGRIVLKKTDNFKTVVEAQTHGNTIFVIKYDFTLTDNVTIPANCVLEFDGGSISGDGTDKDTITGNNTCIKANPIKIFSTDMNFAGSWNVLESYIEWFGNVRYDGVTGYNASDALQAAVNFPSVDGLHLLGVYYINRPIALTKINIKISGSLGRNNIVFAIRCRTDFTSVTVDDKTVNSMFYRTINTTLPTIFKDLTLSGSFKANTVIEPDVPNRISAIRMDNVSVQQFYEAGVVVHSADYNSFHEVEFQYCTVGIEIGGKLVNYDNPIGDFAGPNPHGRQGNHVVVDNCSFIANEVGVIAEGVSDLILTSNLFGYNSLCTIRISLVSSTIFENNYIEGDCNYNFRIYKDREGIPNYSAKTGVVSDEFDEFTDVDFRAYLRIEYRSDIYINNLYVSNFYVRSYQGAPGNAHINTQVPGIDGLIFAWYYWMPESINIGYIHCDESAQVGGSVVKHAYDIISAIEGNKKNVDNSIKTTTRLVYRHYYYKSTPPSEINGLLKPVIASINLEGNDLKYGVDVTNTTDANTNVIFPSINHVLKESNADVGGDVYYSCLQGIPSANSLKILWDSMSYDVTYKVHMKVRPTAINVAFIQVKVTYSDNTSKTLRFKYDVELNKTNDIYYYFTKNEFIEEGKTCVAIFISDYTPYDTTNRTNFKLSTEGSINVIEVKMPQFLSFYPHTDIPISLFRTDLKKLVWYTGDTSVGDNGWVDANGNNPSA